jgi:hypothetical protein
MSGFQPDVALAAMLYLIEKSGGEMDKYQLVKMMYLADKIQLHRWGQTITGGSFAALPWGAVVSEILDLLNAAAEDPKQDQRLGEYARKFLSVERAPTNTVKAISHAEMNFLSRVACEILDEIHAEHGHYDKKERFDKMHELVKDQAYQTAWERLEKRQSGKKSEPMSMYDIAEDNKDLLQHLNTEAELT